MQTIVYFNLEMLDIVICYMYQATKWIRAMLLDKFVIMLPKNFELGWYVYIQHVVLELIIYAYSCSSRNIYSNNYFLMFLLYTFLAA
jgi:hypothetical protein